MLLRLKAVEKGFRTGSEVQQVLHGVDLTLDAGDTLALTGESGSGKSTVLHIAGGLEMADAGEVYVDGHDLVTMGDSERAELRRNTVGVVFQQFNRIPSLTVAGNISFQARLAGSEDASFTAHLIDKFGLREHLSKYPEALSGGQQQRVAIARTLAARPKLILADEPTGNLDEATATEVLDQMLALVPETGAALLVVTHSAAVAHRMAHQVHLQNGRLT